MAPRRTAEHRQTVTTQTTTTTTHHESTEHDESEDVVQPLQQVQSRSHKHSSSRRQSSSREPVATDQVQTTSRRERSKSHGQSSHGKSSRSESRHTHRSAGEKRATSSHTQVTTVEHRSVQGQGDTGRRERHREPVPEEPRRRESRREGGRSLTETHQTNTVRTVTSNRNETSNDGRTIARQRREDRRNRGFEQAQGYEAYEEHEDHEDHLYIADRRNAGFNTTTTTETTTVTTFNLLQESFANGERAEYGDQNQFHELQRLLQERVHDESLDPTYWGGSQQYGEWMVAGPDWESPPGHVYEEYLDELDMWPPEHYPPVPWEAGRSIAREFAMSQGMLEQHDWMIMNLLGGEMSLCPASLTWTLLEIGYVCYGTTHFLPHSEVDMVLAGARPDGPFIWDRNFLAWGPSDYFYYTEAYTEERARHAAARAMGAQY